MTLHKTARANDEREGPKTSYARGGRRATRAADWGRGHVEAARICQKGLSDLGRDVRSLQMPAAGRRGSESDVHSPAVAFTNRELKIIKRIHKVKKTLAAERRKPEEERTDGVVEELDRCIEHLTQELRGYGDLPKS